jgi:hypothetical protein
VYSIQHYGVKFVSDLRQQVGTSIRRNLFTKDDGNFTADLQNVSFMSLDESIGKIEVDPKEEASVPWR